MEYLVAMWLSAWVIQLWTIFRPMFLSLPKNNIVVQHKIITFLVMGVLVLFLVPLLLLPMMSDTHKLRFQNSFLKGLLGE
jgi:hypothetical protein